MRAELATTAQLAGGANPIVRAVEGTTTAQPAGGAPGVVRAEGGATPTAQLAGGAPGVVRATPIPLRLLLLASKSAEAPVLL